MIKVKFVIFIILLSISTISYVYANVHVKGYYRKNGTYVQPHYRSAPDDIIYNNWSYKGNVNPYTGEIGTKYEQPKNEIPSSLYESKLNGESKRIQKETDEYTKVYQKQQDEKINKVEKEISQNEYTINSDLPKIPQGKILSSPTNLNTEKTITQNRMLENKSNLNRSTIQNGKNTIIFLLVLMVIVISGLVRMAVKYSPRKAQLYASDERLQRNILSNPIRTQNDASKNERWIKFWEMCVENSFYSYYCDMNSIKQNIREYDSDFKQFMPITSVNVKFTQSDSRYTYFSPVKLRLYSKQSMFEKSCKCLDFECKKIIKTTTEGCHYRTYNNLDLALLKLIQSETKKSQGNPLYSEIKSNFEHWSTTKNKSPKEIWYIFRDILHEIKDIFFKLDQDRLNCFFKEYGSIYGKNAEGYVRKTYDKWKNKTISISHQNSDRIVSLLPPYLTDSQREYFLYKVISQSKGYTETIKISVVYFKRDIAQARLKLKSYASNLKTLSIPSNIKDAAMWLCDDNAIKEKGILLKVLDHAENVAQSKYMETLKGLEILNGKGRKNYTSYTISFPFKQVNIVVYQSFVEKLKKFFNA